MSAHNPTRRVLLLSGLLLIAGLAGCIGGEDEEGRFASYDEARAAVVEIYEPVNSTSPVRLGLINPENPADVDKGTLEVVVLLFNTGTNEPVRDAEMTLEAHMPAMGHGSTGEETDPTYDAHGVYIGSTTIGMEGTWVLNLDATLGTGQGLAFDVEVSTGASMDHGDGMDGGNETTEDGNGTTEDGGDGEDDGTGEPPEPEPPEDFTVVFSDNVTSAEYDENWTYEVNFTPAASTLTLAVNGTPLGTVTDALNLTVYDPNGTVLDFVEVSGASEESIELPSLPATGTYSARVHGTGVEASYTLTVDVAFG